MAELYQVVGAILRDLSQARVTSDIYSREVSIFYERDSLLRYFPVPRTEISSVEIDLKFAIREVTSKVQRAATADVLLSGIVEKYTELIARSLVSRFIGAIEAQRKVAPEHPEWQSFKAQHQGEEALRGIQQMLANTLLSNAEKWITYDEASNVVFHANEAQAALRKKLFATDFFRRLSELMQSLPPSGQSSMMDAESLEGELDGRRQWFQSKTREILESRLLIHLRTMGEQLRAMEDAREDVQVEVLVTADQLQDVATAAVSSIKLHTVIRNSVWTQMDGAEGDPDRPAVRRLTPE